MPVFEERGNRSIRRNPLGAEQRTNKLNPHIKPDLGIEPGARFSKVPRTFRVQKAIRKITTCLFGKAGLFML